MTSFEISVVSRSRSLSASKNSVIGVAFSPLISQYSFWDTVTPAGLLVVLNGASAGSVAEPGSPEKYAAWNSVLQSPSSSTGICRVPLPMGNTNGPWPDQAA